VDEYLIDLNATKAAERAGYSPKTAPVQGSRLLKNAKVRAAVGEAQEQRSARTEVTQDWVLERLRENVDRAMQAEAVKDREGNETGEYTYQGAVANGALQLLGKHLGMFVDRSEVKVEEVEQLAVRRRSHIKLA
jgi:phage terminase small subunit